MITELRVRKVCSNRESLTIMKSRKHHDFYRCKACGAIFQVAKLKDVKTHNNIPESLRKIITKKKEAALGCDKP